jgi:hypothetical protein
MYLSKKLQTELKMAAVGGGKLESVLQRPHLPQKVPLDDIAWYLLLLHKH